MNPTNPYDTIQQLREQVSEIAAAKHMQREVDRVLVENHKLREILTLAKMAIEGVYDHNQNPALASCSGGQYEAWGCKVALEAINEVLK